MKKPPDKSQAVLHYMNASQCVSSMRVGVLVITYFPDYKKLARLLSALRNDVQSILVFSNGADASAHKSFSRSYSHDPAFIFYEASHNLGVAAALNQGIDYFGRNGYSYCWTFDQDSLPDKDAFKYLLKAIGAKNDPTGSIAAVVPSVFNRCETSPVPFLVQKTNGQIGIKKVEELGEVMAGITSGMLIDISIWQSTGGARENLFIDYVDTEWCFRAKARGFRIVAVPQARLQHELGSPSDGRLYLRRGKPLTLRPAIRTYYILRNGWAIARMPDVPRGWRRYNSIQSLKIILVAVLYGPGRLKQIAAMFRARRNVNQALS